MSVLPLKADIREGEWHVRYVPFSGPNRKRSFLLLTALQEFEARLWYAIRG
jgi:hypothetical protein